MNVALGRIQLSITIQDRPVRQRDHAADTSAHSLAEVAYRTDRPAKATYKTDRSARAAYRVDDLANACSACRYERPGYEVEIMPCPDGSWRPLFKAPGTRRQG